MATETKRIRTRQGTLANRPTLGIGEMGFSTDTKELHIGSSVGNLRVMGDYITPEMYGGGPSKSAAANTAAFASAITAAVANGKALFIGPGTYQVTATSGNYAVNFKSCGVFGCGPNISIIENIGAGSALKMGGTASDMYYNEFHGFAIKGNASSEDGLVTNTGAGIPTETAYCRFKNIKIYGHGRHGLVHRASWATTYEDCYMFDNGGLGAYLYSAAGDDGTHNAVAFTNCHAIHNGGTGNVGADYLHGGIRIGGGYDVYWQGGSVEQNNAWGFILGHNTGWISRVVDIKNVYMEDNPHTGTASTVGGNFRVAEKYTRIEVHNCWLTYGADAGATGYCFYVADDAEENSYFKEWGNYVSDYGAGTNVRDYGMMLDWTHPYISRPWGDYGVVGGAITKKILYAAGSGQWAVSGFIHCKKNSDITGGIYPFVAGYDGNSGGFGVNIGASIASAATAPPTIAWNGGDLEVTWPTTHYGHVEINLGGCVYSPPPTLDLSVGIYSGDFVRRSKLAYDPHS